VLVNYFLERHGRGHVMSAEALAMLASYDWPGNVRELENCVQQMVALNSGPVLALGDMPSVMHHFHQNQKREGRAMAATASTSAGYAPSHNDEQLHHAPEPLATMPALPRRMPPSSEHEILPLNVIEKRAILRALEHTNGDRSEAANLLGIGRTTLYRKLKEYEAELSFPEAAMAV
jgi:DNA-binding NtrC family response regulator